MTKTHVCIHTDVCVRMPLKDTCTHSCMRAYTHMQDGICSCMAHAHLSLYNAYHTDMLRLYVHVVLRMCACVRACVSRYTYTEAHVHTESNVSYVDDICIITEMCAIHT